MGIWSSWPSGQTVARADRYYSEAAEKMKALTEVARALKALGKNRKAHIARLMNVKR